MPAVVVHCTEERLVDGASDELRRVGFVSEHVEQGIPLRLDPKLVAQLDVALDFVGCRFAGIHEDLVVVGGRNRADSLAELSRKEVVPGRETVMWLRRVALELDREPGHICESLFAEPTALRIVAEHVARVGRHEKLAPVVEDFPELVVHGIIEVGGVAVGGGHGPVENSVDGEPDESALVVLGRLRHDGVQEPKHLLVVLDLRLTRRIRPERNLFEHEVEKHHELRVVLDGILEFLDHR